MAPGDPASGVRVAPVAVVMADQDLVVPVAPMMVDLRPLVANAVLGRMLPLVANAVLGRMLLLVANPVLGRMLLLVANPVLGRMLLLVANPVLGRMLLLVANPVLGRIDPRVHLVRTKGGPWPIGVRSLSLKNTKGLRGNESIASPWFLFGWVSFQQAGLPPR